MYQTDVTCPAATIQAKTTAAAASPTWDTIASQRRSQRSASTPAQGPNSNVGRARTDTAMMEWKGEPLTSRASHPMVMSCNHWAALANRLPMKR